MIIVRWIGVPFALFQVLAFGLPYPPGLKTLALGLVAVLAAGNALVYYFHQRPDGVRRAISIAVGGLGLDIFVISSFVWLYAFDPLSALWAVLFILTLEGAVAFQLAGALGAWATVTIVYIFRELWGSARYDYPLEWNSITFRMGIAGIIAVVAGMMSRDLVRQRAHLRSALDDLQRVDRLRLALISTLGHDVRSPLTVIRGSISTLLSRGSRVSPENTLRLLNATDRQARRLEMLANDLLDLARLEGGRLDLHIEDVPVATAIEQTLSYLDAPEGGPGLQIEIEPDMTVSADPHRLEQIVYNLASNAFRHGKPPFLIKAEEQEGRIKIDFIDGGEGVRVEDQPHLFEAFRSESSSESVGYGLAIVKALVEAQGGMVHYEDARPQGACFSIELPLGQPLHT
jgi:signal transduction histidine kinase